MRYNITGELNVYILEDHENEIGVFERSKSFDVGEPMFYSINENSHSLEATIGKFRNECYVEPEKWVVQMITADFTVGSRKVIAITADDYFDSEGYPLAYTPEELKQEVFTDGLYFTEQQYKAYVFREGWDNCTEDDLAEVKKIIEGYAIEEIELDECFDDDDYEEYDG